MGLFIVCCFSIVVIAIVVKVTLRMMESMQDKLDVSAEKMLEKQRQWLCNINQWLFITVDSMDEFLEEWML
jgi:hypothetical protein